MKRERKKKSNLTYFILRVLKKKRLCLNLYLYRFNQVRSERESKNDFTRSFGLPFARGRGRRNRKDGRCLSVIVTSAFHGNERSSFHGSNGSANRETGSSGITAASKQPFPSSPIVRPSSSPFPFVSRPFHFFDHPISLCLCLPFSLVSYPFSKSGFDELSIISSPLR